MIDSQKNIGIELELLAQRLGLEGLSKALIFPKYFEIETVRGCNANCGMCSIKDWDDKNNCMSDKLFDKIVQEIKGYSGWVNAVCLSRNGEPLLDEGLEHKIEMLKDYGINYVTFSTNASLLDKERADSLIASGLDDIMFSIDGVTKQTFEEIRRGLKFEQVRDNCLEFIERRDKKGKKPSVRVRMTLQDTNRQEVNAWTEFWSSKVANQDTVYAKEMNTWGNQLDSYSNPDKVETNAQVPCISPWSTMIIHFDGKVPLCGVDYNNKFVLGDVSKSGIKEVWGSGEFKLIRALHESGNRNELKMCQGCNIWDLDNKIVYKDGN